MKKLIAIAALVLGIGGQASAQNYKEVKDVPVNTKKETTVVYTDGSSKTYRPEVTSNIPYEDQFAKEFGGEWNAYDRTFHDVEGRLRRFWTVGFSGLGLYNFGTSNFIGGPEIDLAAHFGRWSLEVQVPFLLNIAYPLDGSAAGDHYNSLGAYLLGGWDFIMGNRYQYAWTLSLGAGYQHQITDYKNAQFESANYGLGLVGEVRYTRTIKGRWNFFVAPQVRALPQVKATGGMQEFKWAVGLHAGINFGGPKAPKTK